MTYKFEHLILAYGSNLNIGDWNNYCKKNGLPTDLLQFEDIVKIPDYRLVFDLHSRARQGGVANIKNAIGHFVDAVLFSTNELGLETLRRKEGHPYAYIETDMIALRADGSEIIAKTYIVPQSSSKSFERPTQEYYQICKQGYQAYGICTKNLTLAANGQEPEPLNALFTYGTLMRGEKRHSQILIGDHPNTNLTFSLIGTVHGNLSTNGKFPGLNQRSIGLTHGDYLRFSDIERVLSITDRIEGFSGFGLGESFFRRTITKVNTNGLEDELAWVYVNENNLGEVIPSNNWRTQNDKIQCFYSGLIETYGQFDPTFLDRLPERNDKLGHHKYQNQTALLENRLCSGILTERDLATAAGFYRAWPKENYFIKIK